MHVWSAAVSIPAAKLFVVSHAGLLQSLAIPKLFGAASAAKPTHSTMSIEVAPKRLDQTFNAPPFPVALGFCRGRKHAVHDQSLLAARPVQPSPKMVPPPSNWSNEAPLITGLLPNGHYFVWREFCSRAYCLLTTTSAPACFSLVSSSALSSGIR
jgi:hypothetical protein